MDIGTVQSPYYKASLAELQDWKEFVKKLEGDPSIKHAGIVRIGTPEGYKESASGYKDRKTTIDDLHVNVMTFKQIKAKDPKDIAYRVIYDKKGFTTTLAQYRASFKEVPANVITDHDYIKHFYSESLKQQLTYGSDCDFTCFNPDHKEFNLYQVTSRLRFLIAKSATAKGLTTPFCYFGAPLSPFAWHTEDAKLYSVNFLHFGSDKVWVAIPPSHAEKFEALVMDLYNYSCPNYILKKRDVIIGPDTLRANGIDFSVTIQKETDYIITFPNTYHSGFNKSYNVGE